MFNSDTVSHAGVPCRAGYAMTNEDYDTVSLPGLANSSRKRYKNLCQHQLIRKSH
jgi:hypothetical protein